MSHEQVKLALSLDDKPCLRERLVSGKVSVTKLVRIRSIATEASQEFWAQKATDLSQKALQTLVQDVKQENQLLRAQNSNFDTVIEENKSKSLQLSPQVQQKLLQLQQKGIDINELLLEFLRKREEEIVYEKIAIAEEISETDSRYIPLRTRRILAREHGTKCSIPRCARPSEQLHHTQRFALAKRHDPRYLAPLCKSHHEIAHAIDAKVREKRRDSVRC